MQSSIADKAAALISNLDYAALALIDLDGCPTASIISSLKTDGLKHAWFASGLSGDKANRIRADRRASVCYTNGRDNITLVGEIEILTDPAVKRELWVGWFDQHFAGVEDPNYCIFKFTAQRYNLWVGGKSEQGAVD